MTEPKNLSDIPELEETEQVIHSSETVTPEEMAKLQEQFYDDDLYGGLQNIQVSDEELDRQRAEYEYACSFIDMKDDRSTPCYRTDQVHLKLTPEQLVVLIQALEAVSCDIELMDYLYEEVGLAKRYEQQSYIRMIRDISDDTLNEYVRHRPYSAFLPTWFKKIGKDDVDKKDI